MNWLDDPELDWQQHAACRAPGIDPDLFFPARGESTTEAKLICLTCPVNGQCLGWGIRHEKHGIWGGSSERARRALRRQRNITLTELQPTITLTPQENDAA